MVSLIEFRPSLPLRSFHQKLFAAPLSSPISPPLQAEIQGIPPAQESQMAKMAKMERKSKSQKRRIMRLHAAMSGGMAATTALRRPHSFKFTKNENRAILLSLSDDNILDQNLYEVTLHDCIKAFGNDGTKEDAPMAVPVPLA